jgi:hypothetical protein
MTAPTLAAHPRVAAIEFLKEKIAAGEAGADPYCAPDFIVDAGANETVWVNRCASLCGVILLRLPVVGGGERFRVVLEADVRHELGLDWHPALMLDEPLASRRADAPTVLMDATLAALGEVRVDEPQPAPVYLPAMRAAKQAYDRAYPHLDLEGA